AYDAARHERPCLRLRTIPSGRNPQALGLQPRFLHRRATAQFCFYHCSILAFAGGAASLVSSFRNGVFDCSALRRASSIGELRTYFALYHWSSQLPAITLLAPITTTTASRIVITYVLMNFSS